MSCSSVLALERRAQGAAENVCLTPAHPRPRHLQDKGLLFQQTRMAHQMR